MKKIQINWKLPLNGTIIDFESTHWDAKKGEIITAGFLTENGFEIIQRLNSDADEFKKTITNDMTSMTKPWYAFNKRCEEGFCGFDIECDLQENTESSYESAYGALKNAGLLNHYNSLCDPLFNYEVPRFWDLWKITKDPLLLSKIVRHNYCCLAKEYYLKVKRMDNLALEEIRPFLSSAPIEKLYIHKQLGDII